MKAAIVLIVILGIWLAYKHHEKPLPGPKTARGRRQVQGVIQTTSRGFGGVSNLSRTGNSSPGSGTPAQQPTLASTWAIGGSYSIGNVGVSYQ